MAILNVRFNAAAFVGKGLRSCRCLLGLGLFLGLLQMAWGEGVEEYAIKSALTYNLTVFTEWPPKTFKEPDSDINVCVLGDNFVQEGFAQLANKKIGQHSLRIMDITRSKNISACQVVFAGNLERMALSQIEHAAAGKPILTIDDVDGFSTYKGIVNLQENNGKIRMNINLNTAQQANLKISARVLKLANVISRNP